MATYASDEEQIEALKSWWKENGTVLITIVVIALVALFGSRQWQSSQEASSAQASDLFQEVTELAAFTEDVVFSEENLNVSLTINKQLQSEFSQSIYSRYSALLMARLYVQNNELDKAADELNWILDNPDLGLFQEVDEELLLTARARLARVYLAQDSAQTALDILGEVDAGSYVGAFAEVQGDAYIALGRTTDARIAYQLALETAANPALLELKLGDLGE